MDGGQGMDVIERTRDGMNLDGREGGGGCRHEWPGRLPL